MNSQKVLETSSSDQMIPQNKLFKDAKFDAKIGNIISGRGYSTIRINLSPNMRGRVITPPSLFHSYQRVFVEIFSGNIAQISVMRLENSGNFDFDCTTPSPHHVCFDQQSKLQLL